MRSLKYVAAFAAALVLIGAADGRAAEKWNLATGFNETNFQTQNVKFFADEVKRLTNGDIDITVHSGMSLYRQPEIKRAVSSGQIQAGEILLSAYGNEDAMFEADAIPFLAAGYDNAMKLWKIQRPLLEQRFEKQGLMLLYSVAWPGTAVYSRAPVTSVSEFRGIKMRAYNSATSRLAEKLGATPTTVEQVEAPQAFATGVIQAMITSPITGVDSQAWDYVKNYLDVRAWHNKNFVIINRRVFNRLDKKNQEAILQAAKLAEERGWKISKEAGEKAIETLKSRGMVVAQPSPAFMDEIRKVSESMIEDWAKRAGPDGEAVVKAMAAK
jgi:TRAP-type C4-dicarboxylate transport system substrate-binding protein